LFYVPGITVCLKLFSLTSIR